MNGRRYNDILAVWKRYGDRFALVKDDRAAHVTSLREVSRLAGVSIATAGRILRADPTLVVRDETRSRVETAAAELGYRPNRIASGLRTRRTGTIALLLPDPQNFIWSEMIVGAERAAAARDYLLVLADAHGPALDADHYGRLVLEGRVDGVLAAFASIGDELVRQMAARGMPLVAVNSRSELVAGSATMDDAAGSHLAVAHLVGLGHRRIGFLAGRRDTDVGRRREAGYRAAMAEHGLEVREGWVRAGDFTEARGAAVAAEFLAARGAEVPTALFIVNFFSALGVLRALRQLDRRVPDDLSIVTIDDHLVAEHLDPPLTTIRLPMRRMGEQGASLLLDAIGGAGLRHVVAEEPPELIVRRSTAPPSPVAMDDGG